MRSRGYEVIARSLLTTRPEQKCAPIPTCLMRRTIWGSLPTVCATRYRQLWKSYEGTQIFGLSEATGRPAIATLSDAVASGAVAFAADPSNT
jgi:hypothetical protein